MPEEESKEKEVGSKKGETSEKKVEPKKEEPKKKGKEEKITEKYEPIFKIKHVEGIPPIPDEEDLTKVDVRYTVIEPYVQIHIYWVAEDNELHYDVEEPELTEKEKKTLKVLKDGMNELINISFINIESEEKVIEFLEKNVRVLIDEFNLKVTKDQFIKFMYYLYRDFIGLDIVEPLMSDYYIEDIECNGFETPIYIVHRKFRNLRTNVTFKRDGSLVRFVEKLAQKCSQYVSYANPLLDGVLPNGSRVNATYTEDVSSHGPTFCIVDGYVQFSNGEVKKIDEFFKESRTRFGSKIKDGNEIVELHNVKCCGVKGEDLEQIDADVKMVTKLKPPKRLVRVVLADGSDIVVTENHKFHVVSDNLSLVEASKLKPGMIMPVPTKVKVEGCLQDIDRYNLLREFSYLQNICIASTSEVNNIVNNEICAFRDEKGRSRPAMAQHYGVSNYYFYEILNNGSSVSFEVLNKICGGNNVAINNLADIHVVVYEGGTKGRPKAIRVPDKVDETLAYLAGTIISDGHLTMSLAEVSCFEEGVREAVKEAFVKIFGRYQECYGGGRISLSNKFVPFFFNKVFGIPFGKRFYRAEVPEIIFKSENKVVASFVKGLFDGGGTCKSGLSYKTKSKKLAEQLTFLLSRLGMFSKITHKDGMYRVIIPSIYECKYAEVVGFRSYEKQEHLKELLAKKCDVKSYIRHGRVPAEPVFKLLKEHGISKNRVVKACKVNYNRLVYSDTLSKPFVHNIIKFLENEGVEKEKMGYLNWLLDTEQEFVKVVEAKVFDNSEELPVYDIEVSPCKFFIGGNKPLNMFDTLRKFTKEPWTPVKLMDFLTVSPEILAYLWLLIEYRSNMLVIGGTGSGKTSFMNCLAFFIPPAARVVSIEDTRELQLKHENWLPSVSRKGVGATTLTGVKHGEVSLFDLLKESLRQRPDYIIVGEIRGKEAFVLFQAMASGHPSYATMHAESVETLLSRLTTPPISLSPALVESLDAVCIMIPARVKGKDVRKLRQVTEIVNVVGGKAVTNTPFVWDPSDDKFKFKTASKIFEKIMNRTGMTWPEMLKEFKKRTELLMALYRQKVFDFAKVQDVIHEYYKVPDVVLQRYGIQVK